MKLRFVRFACFAIFLLSFAVAIFLPNLETLAINEPIFLSTHEFDNPNLFNSQTLRASSGKVVQTANGETKKIDIKLFGLIKIKTIKVETLQTKNLIASGRPIGISTQTNGLVVLQNYHAFGLKKGDLLTHIVASMKETPLYVAQDLKAHIEANSTNLENNANDFCFKFVRNGKTRKSKPFSPGDALGLWLKDETSVVGMLTYINPENNNFGALGHALADFETGAQITAKNGKVYKTQFSNIEKSNNNHIGVFNASIDKTRACDGDIHCSNNFGVFGCLNETSTLLATAQKTYPVASRYSVHAGVATLIASIDGGAPQEYQIEIIKPKFQFKPKGKSMLIRITDTALLAKTGGIIHGMSGSPILQDGKLIGALTHALKNDATKGFATYIDYMIA